MRSCSELKRSESKPIMSFEEQDVTLMIYKCSWLKEMKVLIVLKDSQGRKQVYWYHKRFFFPHSP